VPKRPAFVPREWLRVKDEFGKHEDVEWKLAGELAGAVQLARSREQHHLAYLLLRRGGNYEMTVPDLAVHLGVDRGDLSRKGVRARAGPGA
jgi:hypothetical protein